MLTTLQTPCETGLTRESVLKANCARPKEVCESACQLWKPMHEQTCKHQLILPATCMQAHPQGSDSAQRSLCPHKQMSARRHSQRSVSPPRQKHHMTR